MNEVPDSSKRVPVFRRDAFQVGSLEEAMWASLFPQPDATTEERWEKETQFHVEDIARFVALGPENLILDFGCGPGRMSKALIDRHGSRVVGVDSSPTMALVATEYVLSERFAVWSPAALDKMVERGFQADFCVCLWVIQHALDAKDVVQRIKRALKPGGILYSLNETRRCVPTDQGWLHDGFDLQSHLRREFTEVACHLAPATAFPPAMADRVMIQVLRKA